LRTFSKFMGRLPFSGRALIRPGVNAVRQSQTRCTRAICYIALMVLLVILVVAHGYQAWMGVSALGFLAPIWAKCVFALYGLVNSAVTLTQVHIICRTTRYVVATPLKAQARRLSEFTITEEVTMFLVTLGGQAAFAVPYLMYQ
jgi:hypothetical protein